MIFSLILAVLVTNNAYAIEFFPLVATNADGTKIHQGFVGKPIIFQHTTSNDDIEPLDFELLFTTRLPNDTIVDKKIIPVHLNPHENKTVTYQFVPIKEGNFITSVFTEPYFIANSIAFSALDDSKNYHTEIVMIHTDPTKKNCSIVCTDPSTLTVNVGTVVEWLNESPSYQTIQTGVYKEDAKGTSFSADNRLVGVIPLEGKFSFLFLEPGDYKYYFSDHRFLQYAGTIHVIPDNQLPSQELLEKARQNIQPAQQVISYEEPPLKQFKSGVSSQEVQCKDDLKLVIKIVNSKPACVTPTTKQKLIERGWAIDHTIIASIENKKVNLLDPAVPRISDKMIDYHELIILVSKPLFVDLFAEKGITVHQDDIELMIGPWVLIYTEYSSACGYAIVDDKVYWLQSDIEKDTLTKASIMTENPDTCRPSYDSCFCQAQYQMTENTITELSYFDKSQEAYVGKMFQDYLNQGYKVVNVPKKFVVGDHNFESSPDETTFCGAFVSEQQGNFGPDRIIRDGVVAHQYLSGVIKNDNVISFSLAEPMKLCAINTDAQVYDFVR